MDLAACEDIITLQQQFIRDQLSGGPVASQRHREHQLHLALKTVMQNNQGTTLILPHSPRIGGCRPSVSQGTGSLQGTSIMLGTPRGGDSVTAAVITPRIVAMDCHRRRKPR